MNVELWHLERPGVNLIIERQSRFEIVDQRDIGARAAHIQGDDIGFFDRSSNRDRSDHATDRTGQERTGTSLPCRFETHGSTV